MTHLSRHISNDDPRHYRFVRNSGLPLGTFPRRTVRRRSPSVDRIVVWFVVALGVIAALFI